MSDLVEEYRGRRGGGRRGRRHWGGRRGGWHYPYSWGWGYPYYYPTTIIREPAATAAPVVTPAPGISQTNLLLLIMTVVLVMILMLGSRK